MMPRGAALLLLLLLAACSSAGLRLDNGRPGLNVALAALRGGSPQVALQVTEDVLARSPDNRRALVVQGDALTALGRFDDARRSYKKALTLDPASVGAHIGLGRILLGTDPAQAEAMFLESLQLDPRNTTALNDLGIARDLQGHHAAAQQAYSRALGIEPDLHAAQVNLALSLAMSGHTGRAMHLLKPMASVPGASRKLRHDLAAVLTMAGKRAAAARILSRDLSPAEVQQALQAYASARSGARPTPLLAGSASGGPETPAPPSPPHPPADPAPTARPRAPAAAPRNPAAARQTSSAAGVEVQFSASPSAAAAHAEWQHLQHRVPTLVAARQPIFMKVARDGQTFWRVRTTGFADATAAHTFCLKVEAAGNACVVASR